MTERNIAITLGPEKHPLSYNTVSPIFYDGASRPHILVQAKGPKNTKFALLLRLDANDVWIEVFRDMAIWGEVALVQHPGGAVFLDGQTRDLKKHLSANIPDWKPTMTQDALHAMQAELAALRLSVGALAGGTSQ